MNRRPRLAITLGDPAGIGPEVILKALAKESRECDVTVFGHRALLTSCYQQLINHSAQDYINPERLLISDLEHPIAVQLGHPSVKTGAASFTYVKTAIDQTLSGEFDAVVTGPIAKSVWKQAGHHYAGQTELLAECSDVKRFGMMFVARSPHTQWQLRSLLATTHIPLADVPRQLTPALLSRKLDLLLDCLARDFGLTKPCLLYTSPSPRDLSTSRMPSSA